MKETKEDDNIATGTGTVTCPSSCFSSGGSNPPNSSNPPSNSGRSGIDISFFNAYPSDVNTYVPTPITGGLKPYRKAPHTVHFS